MDQPSIDGINTWFASKAAAERGYKVVLSGIGGDELFAGYSSFSQIPRLLALGRLTHFFGGTFTKSIFNKASRYLKKPKLAGYLDYCRVLDDLYLLKRGLFLPNELFTILDPEEARKGLNRLGNQFTDINSPSIKNSMAKIGMLESTQYLKNQLLRDSDWASMAHSLELRTPLVDSTVAHEIAKYAQKFSGGIGKKILSNVPNKSIPKNIQTRKKTGFSIPINKWCHSYMMHNNKFEGKNNTNNWARKWALILGEAHSGRGSLNDFISLNKNI